MLPITKIVVEAASFDIQKIKNPGISGKDCRQGDQMGFWNVREYVLFRDGHACHGRRNCKNPILNVHHIESRKVGGDARTIQPHYARIATTTADAPLSWALCWQVEVESKKRAILQRRRIYGDYALGFLQQAEGRMRGCGYGIRLHR
ncbi:MAG: RRXRR domain-containing protein [Clostridiales bacterium]|nr:RRXRR domain-containing protein [Clostridiales bacterium]